MASPAAVEPAPPDFQPSQPLLADPINNTNALEQAQTGMCKGHANGSISIVVSGLTWLINAGISYQYCAKQAVWILLAGKMFIYPVSPVINKMIGLIGTPTKGNLTTGKNNIYDYVFTAYFGPFITTYRMFFSKFAFNYWGKVSGICDHLRP